MIVIAAATELEMSYIKLHFTENPKIKLLVTGAGLVNATFATTKFLMENPKVEMLINIGIVGYVGNTMKIGDCVEICSETWIETGMQDDGNFINAFSFPFFKNEKIYDDYGKITWNKNEIFSFLPKVSSITSSIVHGNNDSVKYIEKNYHGYVESMEGWAFAYVCKALNIPFCSIKSISNYVEPRNPKHWNIDLALKNLSEIIVKTLK